jgi:hypothetical protein
VNLCDSSAYWHLIKRTIVSNGATTKQVGLVRFIDISLFKPIVTMPERDPEHYLDILIERRMKLIITNPKLLPEVTKFQWPNIYAKPPVNTIEKPAFTDIAFSVHNKVLFYSKDYTSK